MPSITHTITRDDDTFTLDVEYEVAAYDPGNSWGPPEDCEPPSGGEITSLDVYKGDEKFELTDAETDALEQRIYETHDYSDAYDDSWSSD